MVETSDQDQRIHELTTQVAVLEKEIKVKYAETESAIERMNAAFERLRTDMAKRDIDMAKRDNRLIISVLGIMVAGITILGFILTSTSTP